MVRMVRMVRMYMVRMVRRTYTVRSVLPVANDGNVQVDTGAELRVRHALDCVEEEEAITEESVDEEDQDDQLTVAATDAGRRDLGGQQGHSGR